MKYFLSALSIVFFISCGGGGEDNGIGTSALSCSVEDQNRFLYEYMKSWYLWNDQMPDISDFSAYSSPNNLLSAVRVSQDRWSYILSSEELENDFSGNEYNFGFTSKVVDDELLIIYTLPNSPIREAGIKRGYVIRSLNGESIKTLVANNNLGKMLDNNSLTIIYHEPDSTTLKSVYVQKANYTTSPVLYSSVIQSGDYNIGYVVLEAFDYKTNEDMASVFSWFKQKSVNKIIVDLRYNGGGILDEVNYLGYMLKSSVGGKKSFSINFNDNHTKSNTTSYFSKNIAYNPFDFDTIVFLTSKNTASASESLINSLKPYANVYLIGSDTHGKPVGMRVVSSCGNSYLPIVFQVKNALGNSFSFDGINADCKIEDSGRYSFGDSNESLLRAGINYITTGVCNSNFATSRALEDKIFTDIRRYKAMIVKP